MDAKTKDLVVKAEWFAHPEIIGQGDGASEAAEMIAALRMAVLEQDKRARHAEQERDVFDKRITELETENAAYRKQIADAERLLKEERSVWASHSSSWALFQKDPDAWLPYVMSGLERLAQLGVSPKTINSLTPFPDAAERINKENAIVQQWAKNALQQRMSDISEACWCARWLIGTEYALWRFVLSGPGEWGQETVSLADVDELKTLSHMCKGWFVWGDEEPDIKFVPMREWIDVFTDWETRHGR